MAKHGHRPTNYKWLTFEKVGACDICTSHKVNQDGYLRKRIGLKLTMLHRAIYMELHGFTELPSGYTLHHLCGNRACCNPAHIIMMSHTDHASYHNINREFKISEWNNESIR